MDKLYKNNISLIFYKDNHVLKNFFAKMTRNHLIDYDNLYLPIDISVENNQLISGEYTLRSLLKTDLEDLLKYKNKSLFITGFHSTSRKADIIIKDIDSCIDYFIKVKKFLEKNNISLFFGINCLKTYKGFYTCINKINFIDNLKTKNNKSPINVLIQDRNENFVNIR